MKLTVRQPKVSCPKCKTLHSLNEENICPNCNTRYKLPEEYEKLKTKGKSRNSIINRITNTISKLERSYTQLRSSTKHLLKLSLIMALMSVVFLVILTFCFSDKEPILMKIEKVSVGTLIYETEDDTVNCLFTNGKKLPLGNGIVRQKLQSPDGKTVYLVFSGALSGNTAESSSNYVLKISNYKNLAILDSHSEKAPEIMASADGKYLYVLKEEDSSRGTKTLSLYESGKEARLISGEVKEACISPNGHYALFSVDDSGASKMIKYSLAPKELTNPGIKNSTPIALDNKGDYLIYLKKTDTEHAKIIAEKNTDKRLEIPLLPDNTLLGVVLSQDRRTIGIEYSDRTTFHTCSTDYYMTVLTHPGSTFMRDRQEGTNYNCTTSANELKIENIYGDLLPYYFFDKERQGIYCIEKDGSKIPVFSKTFDTVKICENGNVAFVADGILYCGKLNYNSPDQTELMSFAGKTLVDISTDGKKILYKDADENLFSVAFNTKNDTPKKLVSDPDFVKFSKDGKSMLYTSDKVTTIVRGKKKMNLGESLINGETYVADDNLSTIVYAAKPDGDRKTLYIYSGGKSKIITDNLRTILCPEERRIDVTKSYYINKERQ